MRLVARGGTKGRREGEEDVAPRRAHQARGTKTTSQKILYD